MNKKEYESLLRQMRTDGWQYLETMEVQGGGYAISVGELQRIFYSREQYDEWKAERVGAKALQEAE